MKRSRCAKIIATLGPSSEGIENIHRLFQAGVDVFRLNFSHGTHQEHQRRYDDIRQVEKQVGRPIGIFMDIQGPKIRVGCFENGHVKLDEGQCFRLDLDPTLGNQSRVCLPHQDVLKVLDHGDTLLVNDGKLVFKVIKSTNDYVDCHVMVGGVISDHKGVNLPDVVHPIEAMTMKDRQDIEFGVGLGVDYVALSFVQCPEDVIKAKDFIGSRAKIISKFEKPQAIECLDEIVRLSDAVMVARGDLGVELPPEDVPGLQKRIVVACRQQGRPVIVATQMLESMIENPSPTRAEASDVATAIYDGADALMLSAESAIGKYSLQAVKMMDRIICRVEGDRICEGYRRSEKLNLRAQDADAISRAASQVAQTLNAKAIATYTTSGSTTLCAARERPTCLIFGLTPHLKTARWLTLAWGVHAMVSRDATNFAEMISIARDLFFKHQLMEKDDCLIITAGVPFGTPGATNILRIVRL